MDYELKAAKARQTALLGHAYTRPAAKRVARIPRAAAVPLNLWPVANKIMMATSNCVPDCDPLEILAPWARRYAGLDEWASVTQLLDKACSKFLGAKSYHQYLIDAWDGWNEICEPDQRMDNPWK